MKTRPALQLGVADHGLKLSRSAFAAAHYGEPWRYERVNGRLYVMPPAGPDHQIPTNRFRDHLGAYALTHPEIVEDVISEAWIAVGKNSDRIADIGVYLAGTSDDDVGPDRAPDLVFETVSGGGVDRKRDYVDKRAEYLRVGVKEYVIIDRFERRVTVLRKSRGRFVEMQLEAGDSYTSPLLPGLKVPLKRILKLV